MVCAEKMRLVDQYTRATSLLFGAVIGVGFKTGMELRKGRVASRAARAECFETRRALEDHKAQHGC